MTLSPHSLYEELVAGYALSALEPADEQELLAHLPTCAMCQRDLALHRETLAHLAYAADDGAPPAGVWESIRAGVVDTSGPAAFDDPGTEPGPSRVLDLQAARARRTPSPRVRRVAAWTSVAAALALVGTLGYSVVHVQRERDQQGVLSAQLSEAVRAVETGPARTVPLSRDGGPVTAVAVLQADHLSLIIDGLVPNDPASSVYVLWGQTGAEPATALATFDVDDPDVDVLRDVAVMPAGEPVPQLFVITKEPGRTPPEVTSQPALATGRTA